MQIDKKEIFATIFNFLLKNNLLKQFKKNNNFLLYIEDVLLFAGSTLTKQF